MRTVAQGQLSNESGAILRDVQAGQTVIVTRAGVPVAELRPIAPRGFVPRAAIVEAARGASRIDGVRFLVDLDAVVEQSVNG